MITAIIILAFVGIIFLCKKAEKYFYKRAEEKEEEERYERDYKERTLRALERMSSSMAPKEDEPQESSALENLLEGNRELEEKRKIRKAMKDELGIE